MSRLSRVHDPPRAQRCNTSSYPNSLLDAAKIAHIIAHADVSLQQKRAYSALVRAFASAKRRVRTVVIGGSVTHGTSCEDREHGLKAEREALENKFKEQRAKCSLSPATRASKQRDGGRQRTRERQHID